MSSPSSANDPADSMPPLEAKARERRVGPILFFRACRDGRLEVAALIVGPESEAPPEVVAGEMPIAPEVVAGEMPIAPEVLHRRDHLVVLRYRFSLPAAGGHYRVGDETFEVAGISEGDLRLAYVSCNGQESGDRERSLDERNTMWQRLVRQHQRHPLNLLLHGGDQLYADEMLHVHGAAQAWADGELAEQTGAPAPDQQLANDLRSFLLRAYMQLYSQPAPAWLLARVPSLCMWDDHDICDGWGSLPSEQLDSAVGQELFRAAREFFLLFQLGSAADDPPPICPDRSGTSLTWAAELPGVLLVAPDLRSERRRDRVLGPSGWAALRQTLAAAGRRHVLVLSSVPALGPRLSWVEAVLHWLPKAQKYEDDLRDQWQSRFHRDQWRRFLRELLEVHQRGTSPVTVLSGEIHLATRGTMAAAGGPVHQLVASGVTHPPPPVWYARLLAALARLGESPLPAHPIRLHPLPGQPSIYTAQCNYLMLHRRAGHWRAWWELEHDGPTPPLELES